MRQEIAELHQSLKTTMIYVTHDQVEAMTMADKIVVLNAAGSSRWAARWSFTPPEEPLRRGLHRQPEDEPNSRSAYMAVRAREVVHLPISIAEAVAGRLRRCPWAESPLLSQLDVTQPGPRSMRPLPQLVAQMGNLDILINNAALFSAAPAG
jgi:ABC-type dipeptide/oligopeptide/nickel transport system ATPase component